MSCVAADGDNNEMKMSPIGSQFYADLQALSLSIQFPGCCCGPIPSVVPLGGIRGAVKLMNSLAQWRIKAPLSVIDFLIPMSVEIFFFSPEQREIMPQWHIFVLYLENALFPITRPSFIYVISTFYQNTKDLIKIIIFTSWLFLVFFKLTDFIQGNRFHAFFLLILMLKYLLTVTSSCHTSARNVQFLLLKKVDRGIVF